jgi:FecR protein
MRPEDEDIARLMKKSLPSPTQEEQAGRRVYHTLFLSQSARPAAATQKEDEGGFRWSSRPRFSIASAVMAAAASFVFLVVLGSSLWRIAENHSRPESPFDRIGIGESVRASNPDGRMLVLPDGSLVEMRPQSDLRLERAGDGLRVRLNAGSVIVTAAKQGSGHLYVETRDAIVSVVGTVFLVSSEQTGSRVGVIEGIVNVQHGANSQKLLPGQQLSTNPAMAPVPLEVQVSWSRSAAGLVTLLQPSVPAATRVVPAPAAPLQNTPPPAPPQAPGSLLIIGTSSNAAASPMGQRNAFGNNRGGPAADNSRQTPPLLSDAERALEQAMRSREPITDLPFLSEINYFQLNRAEFFVPVTLKIAGSQLTGSETPKRIVLDILAEVIDDYGTVLQNYREAVDVRLSDDIARGLQARQIVYDTGFTLLPGRYSSKFVIRDGVTGKVGTYQTAVVIPNLSRPNPDLPISAVVLSNELIDPKDALPNSMQPRGFSLDSQLAIDPLFIEGKKLIPSVSRTFSKRRDLIAFLQAYEGNADVTTPLTAFVTIYSGQTKVFETAPITVKEELTGRKWRTLPVRLAVPLSTVPVGSYDCQVTIVDSVTQKSAVWRSPINVVN